MTCVDNYSNVTYYNTVRFPTGSNDAVSTTYILHLFSDLRILRAGVLRPPQVLDIDKNCGRAAGIHQLQHIQSTAETVE